MDESQKGLRVMASDDVPLKEALGAQHFGPGGEARESAWWMIGARA